MDPTLLVALIGGGAAVLAGVGGVLVGHWLGRGSARQDRIRAAQLETIEHTLICAKAQLDQAVAAIFGAKSDVDRLGEALDQHEWADFSLLSAELADELADALVEARKVRPLFGPKRQVIRRVEIAKLSLHRELDEQRMRVLRGEGPTRLGSLGRQEFERRVDKLLEAVSD